VAVERLAKGRAFHDAVQSAFLTDLADATGFKERGWRLVLATSLFGDAAAGFCEDASASLREHPARVRLPNLAPGLRVGNHRGAGHQRPMSNCPRQTLIAKCD